MRALMGIAVAGAVVWVFALIGIATVAATLTGHEPDTEAPLLSSAPAEVADWNSRHIAGLPRYPGAMDTEFRRDVIGTLVLTEIASSTADSIEVVRAYYERLLRDGLWKNAGPMYIEDEWMFSVESDGRRGVITLHEDGPFTIIEVEMSEPADSRGETSHR